MVLCIRDVWLQRCVTNGKRLVRMLWLEDGFLVCKSSEQRPLFPGTSLLKHLDFRGEGHSFLAFLFTGPQACCHGRKHTAPGDCVIWGKMLNGECF